MRPAHLNNSELPSPATPLAPRIHAGRDRRRRRRVDGVADFMLALRRTRRAAAATAKRRSSLKFTLTDQGCIARTGVGARRAGDISVTNGGTTRVTELELQNTERDHPRRAGEPLPGLSGYVLARPAAGHVHTRLSRRERDPGRTDGDRQAPNPVKSPSAVLPEDSGAPVPHLRRGSDEPRCSKARAGSWRRSSRATWPRQSCCSGRCDRTTRRSSRWPRASSASTRRSMRGSTRRRSTAMWRSGPASITSSS